MNVAIIPARAGSKRVPHKNLRLLNNKPLLAWAIETCKASMHIQKVVVSTDDDADHNYSRIANEHNVDIVWRPPDLAEDVPTEDVIESVVKVLNPPLTGIIVTVQCTTPLLRSTDIDRCIEALLMPHPSFGIDSAMTVTKVTERPEWMFAQVDGYLRLFNKTMEPKGQWGVSQTLPELYRPNGACYATWLSYFLMQKRIIGDRCVGIKMPYLRSFDVDTEEDLEILNALLKCGVVHL